jgi:hypothetical protein
MSRTGRESGARAPDDGAAYPWPRTRGSRRGSARTAPPAKLLERHEHLLHLVDWAAQERHTKRRSGDVSSSNACARRRRRAGATSTPRPIGGSPVGRKNSVHRPFLLPRPVKGFPSGQGQKGGQRDQVGGEGDPGVLHIQSGPDRRESAPASAVDRAATPDTTPQAACRRPPVLDSRLSVGSPMARVSPRRSARDRARLASPGVDGLLALAVPTTKGRRAAPHRG